MKLEVTELGPVQRAVKIEVPAEDVTKRFEVAYADLNRRVHIPGFRPGKAPQGLLEQRYAKAIEEDVLRQLLPDYYRRAMKETGFDPVTVDIPPLERIKVFEGAVPSEGIKPENQLLRIGDKAPIAGLVLDDALLGKTKGQVVEVKQPDGGGTADKTITLRATVQELKAKVLPELDDEFAKDLGDYKTLGELQDKVKTQLEQGLQRDIEEKYKDEIMKRLVDLHHHFELPESLVQRELDAMIQNAHQRRRMTWAEAHGEPERMPPEEVRKLREEFLPTAKERVRLGLVLEAIAQKEGIAVAETDIEQECRLMARAMKVEPAEIKKLLLSGGQDAVEDLRSRILADKALQFVYQKAIIQM